MRHKANHRNWKFLRGGGNDSRKKPAVQSLPKQLGRGPFTPGDAQQEWDRKREEEEEKTEH